MMPAQTAPKRWPRSHVRGDGLAKVAFLTEADAIDAAVRYRAAWYLCGQNPSHWHLTKDLTTR